MSLLSLPTMSHILAHTHRTPRWPPTPPDPADPPLATVKQTSSVATALHVMSTERTALAHLEQLYQTDARAQLELARAVDQIVRSVSEGGKLVVCGVGKSGKIGQKIEATMNSLGIYSAFLHPTEALHGDLGLVRPVRRPALHGSLLRLWDKRYTDLTCLAERHDAFNLILGPLARVVVSRPAYSSYGSCHCFDVAYTTHRMPVTIFACACGNGHSLTSTNP